MAALKRSRLMVQVLSLSIVLNMSIKRKWLVLMNRSNFLTAMGEGLLILGKPSDATTSGSNSLLFASM